MFEFIGSLVAIKAIQEIRLFDGAPIIGYGVKHLFRMPDQHLPNGGFIPSKIISCFVGDGKNTLCLNEWEAQSLCKRLNRNCSAGHYLVTELRPRELTAAELEDEAVERAQEAYIRRYEED